MLQVSFPVEWLLETCNWSLNLVIYESLSHLYGPALPETFKIFGIDLVPIKSAPTTDLLPGQRTTEETIIRRNIFLRKRC
jgi:hypothetical protein